VRCTLLATHHPLCRYHSLVVDAASLPEQLEPLAWSCGGHTAVQLQRNEPHPATAAELNLAAAGLDAAAAGSHSDILIMALRHRERPHYGVQFHPESVATRYGVQLLLNFRDIASRHSGHDLQQQQQRGHLQLNPVGPPGRALPARTWPAVAAAAAAAANAYGQHRSSSSSGSAAPQQQQQQQQVDLAGLAPASCIGAAGLQLLWRRLPGAAAAVAGGSAGLFSELVGPGPDTFWLDRWAQRCSKTKHASCRQQQQQQQHMHDLSTFWLDRWAQTCSKK
jgi:para-aminobenzoate synthetase